ncbi:unnamed protein product, partial [Ixodes persulcatus]
GGTPRWSPSTPAPRGPRSAMHIYNALGMAGLPPAPSLSRGEPAKETIRPGMRPPVAALPPFRQRGVDTQGKRN